MGGQYANQLKGSLSGRDQSGSFWTSLVRCGTGNSGCLHRPCVHHQIDGNQCSHAPDRLCQLRNGDSFHTKLSYDYLLKGNPWPCRVGSWTFSSWTPSDSHHNSVQSDFDGCRPGRGTRYSQCPACLLSGHLCDSLNRARIGARHAVENRFPGRDQMPMFSTSKVRDNHRSLFHRLLLCTSSTRWQSLHCVGVFL